MASAALLDFAKLTAPVAGDNPAGSDLRTDSSPNSVYYSVKDARNNARTTERQMASASDEDAQNMAPPDWKSVTQKGIKALEKAKDLEVCAYIIEALCRTNGFAGLRDGFRLTRELVEKYWEKIYPLPDEEGIDTRVAPLTGLNGDDGEGTLIGPIYRIPLTDNTSVGRLDYTHYQQAGAHAKILDPKLKEKKASSGAMTMEIFQKAVGESSSKFYTNLNDDINGAIEEFAKLNATLDQRCQGRSPPSSNIRNALMACQDVLKNLARDKITAPVTASPEGDKPADNAAATAQAGPGGVVVQQVVVPAGAIANRSDALKRLGELAEYFRKYEPHTPVSYAIEQAVRWGNMSLPELLHELIPDEAPRKTFFKQVGIKLPEPPPEAKPAKK